MTYDETTQRIRQLNDLCRSALGVGGRLVQTEGVRALPAEAQSAIRENVERFSDFTEGDDPGDPSQTVDHHADI